jgi:hypothetical protein
MAEAGGVERLADDAGRGQEDLAGRAARGLGGRLARHAGGLPSALAGEGIGIAGIDHKHARAAAGRFSRHHSTGAEGHCERVKTPATVVPSSKIMARRSVRPAYLMPASAVAMRTPSISGIADSSWVQAGKRTLARTCSAISSGTTRPAAARRRRCLHRPAAERRPRTRSRPPRADPGRLEVALAQDEAAQLLLHLLIGRRFLLAAVDELDHMPAELRLDRLAGVGVDLHVEDHGLEFRHHLALAEIAEIAAALGGAVLRMLARQLLEIAAFVEFGDDGRGLLLGLDDDVSRADLFGEFEVSDFPVIAGAKRLVGDLGGNVLSI